MLRALGGKNGVLAPDFGKTTAVVRIESGEGQQYGSKSQADQDISQTEEQNKERSEGDQRSPAPENKDSGTNRVTDAQHTVVQVHAVGVHG